MYPGNHSYQQQPPPQGYYQQQPPPSQYYAQPSPQSPYPQQPPQQPMQYQSVPQGLISTCQGTKKALLVGINYFRQRSELKGCINDVQNVRKFITSRYGFPDDPQHMVILTDDSRDPNYIPTKQNIVNAMRWLVGGAQMGDSLFFHYSGHGGQVKDRDGDEVDGYDSCIYPVDFQQAGSIIDDSIHEMMVKFLPAGVRLTVIMDCCHSGTIVDLPYVYNNDGTLKTYKPGKAMMNTFKASGNKLKRGDPIGAAFSVVGGFLNNVANVASTNPGAEQRARETKTTLADVVLFSGCKDDQTSADTFVGGLGATGAMSYALIRALTENPQQTYLTLLGHVRAILYAKYTQKPQLSSGRPMDMNSFFYM